MALSAATTAGFLLLTGNTIMAARRSRADDAASTAFVAASYASLVLLFYCLRRFETSPTGSGARGRAKAGVWIATALITAMFSWRVAPPEVVVGALILLCLGEFDRARQIGLGRQYAELLKLALGVVACDTAVAHHHAHGDAGSLVFVFIAYVCFLTLTWLFLRRFDGRARGAGGQ